jgi:hypothetical protein
MRRRSKQQPLNAEPSRRRKPAAAEPTQKIQRRKPATPEAAQKIQRPAEWNGFSSQFTDTLAARRGRSSGRRSHVDRFLDLLEVPAHEIMVLVFRLSCAAGPPARSGRLLVRGAGPRS